MGRGTLVANVISKFLFRLTIPLIIIFFFLTIMPPRLTTTVRGVRSW